MRAHVARGTWSESNYTSRKNPKPCIKPVTLKHGRNLIAWYKLKKKMEPQVSVSIDNSSVLKWPKFCMTGCKIAKIFIRSYLLKKLVFRDPGPPCHVRWPHMAQPKSWPNMDIVDADQEVLEVVSLKQYFAPCEWFSFCSADTFWTVFGQWLLWTFWFASNVWTLRYSFAQSCVYC